MFPFNGNTHVEYVIDNPEYILPVTHEDYKLLVRGNGKNKATVVEFVYRGGKYRVRSAYIIKEGQLEIKKEKAQSAVSKPSPESIFDKTEKLGQGGSVPFDTPHTESFPKSSIQPYEGFMRNLCENNLYLCIFLALCQEKHQKQKYCQKTK